MINRVKNYFQQRSIQVVFTTMVVIVSLVGFLGLASVFIHYVDSVIKEDGLSRNNENIRTLVNGIEDEIHRNMGLLDTFYYQVIKNNDVETDKFNNEMSFLVQCNQESIKNVAIIGDTGQVYWNSKPIKNSFETINSSWYKQAIKQIDQIVYASPSMKSQFDDEMTNKTMVIARYVELYRDGNVESAVLLLEINYSITEGMLATYNQSEYSHCYIVDQSDNYIYHPEKKTIDSGVINDPHILVKSLNSDNVVIDGENFHVDNRMIGYVGWQLYSLMSLDLAFIDSQEIKLYSWLAVLVSGLLVVLADRYIVKKITKPLLMLSDTVASFGEGNLNVQAKVTGANEISRLAEDFNRMAISIRGFMKNIFCREEEKWETELRLLQSQINPHFLYNSLDSIIWMIQSKQNDTALEMVSALAKFFRISLSKGNEIITLDKELQHGESYLKIQNIRFQDRFTYLINKDESLYQYVCPKIILQPIIENAVYHGMKSMSGEGEVIINLSSNNEDIIIEVIDNGEGMSEQQVYDIMHKEVVSSSHGSGIGVRNVDQRLKVCFGSEYGIEIESEIDEGTTVRIKIPKVVNIHEYHKKTEYYLVDYFDRDDRDD